MEKNVNLSYAKMMMVDFSVGTISSKLNKTSVVNRFYKRVCWLPIWFY